MIGRLLLPHRMCMGRFFLFRNKVRIFWEGHKIWKNLPLKIWRHSVTSNFNWKIFFKFSGLLRISELYLQRIQLLPEWLCSRSNNVCWLQLDSVTFEFFWREKLFQNRSQDPSWLQLPFDWLAFLKDYPPNHTQELHGTKINIGLGKKYNHMIKYFGLFQHDQNLLVLEYMMWSM